MTMCKYLITVHKDGHITAQEFDEPGDIVNRFNNGVFNAMTFLARMADERVRELRQKAQGAAIVGNKEEAALLTARYKELEYFVPHVTRSILRLNGIYR